MDGGKITIKAANTEASYEFVGATTANQNFDFRGNDLYGSLNVVQDGVVVDELDPTKTMLLWLEP